MLKSAEKNPRKNYKNGLDCFIKVGIFFFYFVQPDSAALNKHGKKMITILVRSQYDLDLSVLYSAWAFVQFTGLRSYL